MNYRTHSAADPHSLQNTRAASGWHKTTGRVGKTSSRHRDVTADARSQKKRERPWGRSSSSELMNLWKLDGFKCLYQDVAAEAIQ